ncbi:MAG TPA: sensor histidine kinase [Chthoniobacteraceae bacterium]|nr:sensor histidine kinase [Chthoniobacteraceae bacterium]
MATALSAFIGYLDYTTGYELNLVVFYSIPILFAVWFGERRISIFIALLCAIFWWWADVKSGHPYLFTWLETYNTAVSLVFFLFVESGGTALKKQLELLERTQRLEREIIRISEYEQQRIGQDLHDGLCQYLAAIGCAASSLRNDLQLKQLPEAAAAGEIAELLKQGVTQSRNLSRGLFPVQMDEAGLESALSELAASSTRLLNIDCEFEAAGRVPIYDYAAATHLYRISQEALNNATRHGKASKVTISLRRDGDTVILCVTDNGKGLPKANGKTDGMGLKIMDYRAHLIDGWLEIGNRPNGGVTVTCSFRQGTIPLGGAQN